MIRIDVVELSDDQGYVDLKSLKVLKVQEADGLKMQQINEVTF